MSTNKFCFLFFSYFNYILFFALFSFRWRSNGFTSSRTLQVVQRDQGLGLHHTGWRRPGRVCSSGKLESLGYICSTTYKYHKKILFISIFRVSSRWMGLDRWGRTSRWSLSANWRIRATKRPGCLDRPRPSARAVSSGRGPSGNIGRWG